MGYPSKNLLAPKSCSLLFSSRVSLSINQLLALFQGAYLLQLGPEPMFKHSTPVLACHYRKVKGSKLQLQKSVSALL